MAKPSTVFDIGAIVRVPFPYVERDRHAVRPALIVSRPLGPDGLLVWTLMITSARRGPWPGDIPLGPDHAAFGLPVPCVVRTAKMAALAVDAIDGQLGQLPSTLLADVQRTIATALSLTIAA